MRLTKTDVREKYNTLVDQLDAETADIARVLVAVERALTDDDVTTLKAYLITEGCIQMLEDLMYS